MCPFRTARGFSRLTNENRTPLQFKLLVETHAQKIEAEAPKALHQSFYLFPPRGSEKSSTSMNEKKKK